jgi:hypothetical protein
MVASKAKLLRTYNTFSISDWLGLPITFLIWREHFLEYEN